MNPVTRGKSLSSLFLKGFFFIIKMFMVLVFILIGAMVVSQSSVAPVSTRLLSAYALEYATKTIKPYRHLFPKPYMVHLEE